LAVPEAYDGRPDAPQENLMVNPLFTQNAPPPFSNYSQAIEVPTGNRLLFVAGQVGANTEV